MLSKLTMNIT